MFNLLEDQFINIIARGRTDAATLPEVNAGKMADTVDALPALQLHHCHARYTILVQCVRLPRGAAQHCQPDGWPRLNRPRATSTTPLNGASCSNRPLPAAKGLTTSPASAIGCSTLLPMSP